MHINILNPVFSRVATKDDAILLSQILKHKVSIWREGPFYKEETIKEKVLVKQGMFLTGFIPRIEEELGIHHIPVVVSSSQITPSPLPPVSKTICWYSLGDQTLDSPQIEAVKAMLSSDRGVIHYPTASGKTVIFLYFLSLFPTLKSLIIVNTKPLLYQNFERANQIFPNVGIIGDGKVKLGKVTVAMIQSLMRLEVEFFKDLDIVIVDECHHISSFSHPFVRKNEKGGSYARVLSKIMAPFRYGFTGTVPYLEEAKWALEGYIGPVIAKKKMIEVPRVAKIKVILRKLPLTTTAKEAKLYRDVYRYSVVFNSRRHLQVLKDTNYCIGEGRTVLILVTEIFHGNNILRMAERHFPQMKIKFVWANVLGKEEIKQQLNNGTLQVVIANVVWREGVDIPTLGAIINAAGGRSEIMTLQGLGRGLRTVPGLKEEVWLFDYFDPSNRYLIEHFGQRVTLYFDEGWM